MHIIASATLFAIVGLVPASAVASDPKLPTAPPTIRVVTEATVSAKPDQAEIELGVTTDKKTARAAVTENNQELSRIVAALKKELGPDGELKTSEVNVRARFGETRNGEITARVLGYTATNTVRLRVTNLEAVAGLLDVAVRTGANTVESVAFTLKDPEGAQNQALRAASAKARARAVALAEGLGLQVGEVISLTEGPTYGAIDALEGLGGISRRAMTSMPIESGSLDVQATVTVIFGLKPR